jgi:hypothetical protein
MEFLTFAADLIGKLVVSLGARSLSDQIKVKRTERILARLVESAVDRIVDQADGYLTNEKISDEGKEMLIVTLCARLEPLVAEPQRLFAANLDGRRIFEQCHPNGSLPEEIREEGLAQCYSVLFPQIAHFLAGSKIALFEWEAEGYREDFRRLSLLAQEISEVTAKVAELPKSIAGALAATAGQRADQILSEFGQTLLNDVLVNIDISPLRAERALHGTLSSQFVVPALLERPHERVVALREGRNPRQLSDEGQILEGLMTPGGRQVVYGRPGAGKSTFSLWLQSRLLQERRSRIAVVLRLREVDDIERRSLGAILRSRASPHMSEALTDDVLREWHAAGRLCVILDGFDEVPMERRGAVEVWIKGLAAVVKQTTLIVTSRSLQSGHLEGLEQPWNEWELLPFDRERVVEFIERWRGSLALAEGAPVKHESSAEELAAVFSNDPSLSPLSDTPLMLGTLLFVHYRDKRLPSGRVDLYERYIAAMLGQRDDSFGIRAHATRLQDRQKRQLLARVALRFHALGVNQVSDAAMRQIVSSALVSLDLEEDVEHLLRALSERTGLLQGPGAWSYAHKTLGEFLVAELVCDGSLRFEEDRRLDRRELWKHRHEDSWMGVLFFWAGMTRPRELEEFILELIEEGGNGPLLAVSLFLDQHARFDRETQRRLALAVISVPFCPTVIRTLVGYYVIAAPFVPPSCRGNFQWEDPDLSGFSASVNAFGALFARGVLVAGDVGAASGKERDILMGTLFESIHVEGTRTSLQDLRHLEFLTLAQTAVFAWGDAVRPALDDESTSAAAAIDQWLEAFPEARSWPAFLLMGEVIHAWNHTTEVAAARGRTAIRLLWERRTAAVGDDCLLMSAAFVEDWQPISVRSETGVDLLRRFQSVLSGEIAGGWEVDPEQLTDLRVFCDELLRLRSSLPANASE